MIVKNKATRTPLSGVKHICPSFRWKQMHIHRRGAFSVARFDYQGNAKALHRGPGTELAPRFLFVCMNLNY